VGSGHSLKLTNGAHNTTIELKVSIKERRNMKRKSLALIVIAILLLTACGQNKIEQSLTLQDQDKNQVTLPSDTPMLFFFITTYT
jgi:hypothetical protein